MRLQVSKVTCIFAEKAVENMVTKRDLLNLLPDDKKLCRIYGWERKSDMPRPPSRPFRDKTKGCWYLMYGYYTQVN